MDLLKRFAARLKTLRAKRKLSQEALAAKARVSRVHLARLEMGQQDPSLTMLSKLAHGLDVRISQLTD
jgi:transcriptional regulator with XRE-family HTH domain